jgi:hypothetical protein
VYQGLANSLVKEGKCKICSGNGIPHFMFYFKIEGDYNALGYKRQLKFYPNVFPRQKPI